MNFCKVIEILKSFVVVDARAKSEAMIPISEFSQEELAKLKVGSTINCFLERIENMRTGEIVLSYDKAKRMDAWNKVVKAFDNKEEIDGMITSKIKGGFINISNRLPVAIRHLNCRGERYSPIYW